jgi:hypothetical protein
MTVDHFEDNLRAALARCADEVPAHVVARLGQREYGLHAPRRHRAAGLATLAVAVAAGAAGFVIGTRTPSYAVHTAGAPDEQTIRLADATIALPAGFARSETACVGTPAGLQLVGASFAAAVSHDGGCITLFLAASTSAPSEAQAVVIGGYAGAVVTDASTGVSTEYITIPADLYVDGSRELVIENRSATLDLVIASRGLSPEQVATIAAAGIPDHPVSDG